MVENGVTISEAARKYAQSLKPEQVLDAHEAMRFARWLGEGRSAGEIRPPDVESYVESFSSSAPNASLRADSLKAFLAYAHKNNLMPDRLVTHVRVRKPSTSKTKANGSGVLERPEVHLTRDGLTSLTADLEALKGQRPKMAADLRDAAADKDFRENAPLDAAREAQGQLEARIRELEGTLKHAVVISDQGVSDAARIGARIVISNVGTGSRLTYVLVSSREAKPTSGLLSVESPVGQALMGRRAGDEVEVQAPSGSVRFRIETVET